MAALLLLLVLCCLHAHLSVSLLAPLNCTAPAAVVLSLYQSHSIDAHPSG